MNSLLLNTATRYIIPLLLALSLVLLYRGHNLPGGGFIGGLMAASAVILRAYTCGWDGVEKRLLVDPLLLMTIGLAVAAISGFFGVFAGHPFMTGLWLPTFELPLLGKVKLGTPLLFDIGVYFGVIGFTLKCALALGTHSISWKS